MTKANAPERIWASDINGWSFDFCAAGKTSLRVWRERPAGWHSTEYLRADIAEEALGTAARDVLAERQRQKDAEGWSHEHDDTHADAELAVAAAAYALNASIGSYSPTRKPHYWPVGWGQQWWKPKDRRRDLVRAGALILAEIERLDRARATNGGRDDG